MIVILDCNIWISLALNRQLSFLGVLEDEGIIIAACPELFHELKGVVSRPKFHNILRRSILITCLSYMKQQPFYLRLIKLNLLFPTKKTTTFLPYVKPQKRITL